MDADLAFAGEVAKTLTLLHARQERMDAELASLRSDVAALSHRIEGLTIFLRGIAASADADEHSVKVPE